jgi:hypothetical protein
MLTYNVNCYAELLLTVLNYNSGFIAHKKLALCFNTGRVYLNRKLSLFYQSRVFFVIG